MRPGEATAAAEKAARSIDSNARYFALANPLLTPFFLWFGQVATGEMKPPEMLLESIAMIEAMPRDHQIDVRFTANDTGVLCLWQEHRQVISVDPDLWAELTDTRTDMVIPAGLFEQLPYPDPFIAFPEPLRLPLDGGQYMTVGGFFVTGRASIGVDVGGHAHHVGQVPVSTAVSHVQQGHRWYGLTFTGETWNADGTPIFTDAGERDVIWTRLTVRDGVTVDDMLSQSMSSFLDSDVGGDAPAQARTMMRAAVAVLIYLCADNRDVRVINPPPVVVKRPGKAPRRIKSTKPTVVEVGFRIGATIREYRAKRAAWKASNPTGRTMPPHLRAAHFQSFRVGPGRPNQRTETVVKWVSFIEVNMGRRTRDDRPTVHRAAKAQRVRNPK